MNTRPSKSHARMTCLGTVFVFVIIVASLAGAYYLFFLPSGASLWQEGAVPDNTPRDATAIGGTPAPAGQAVRVGIAYGTEKRYWLQWAVTEFQKTPAGRDIDIQLIPLGSREGALKVLEEDKRIHVWSPASELHTDFFVQEWKVKHGGDPIARKEFLALSPMVFVFWKERHQAFAKRYPKVTWQALSEALAEPTGWQGLAEKPEWGVFKFGHTHPGKSNSGGVSLLLMAYAYHDKLRGLAMADILDAGFLKWLSAFEQAVSGLSHSTGSMMREMVLKGPSSFDALCVYENLAIDYLKKAEGRWGKLHVAYPDKNMWNNNPYYILDVPWCSDEQRQGAEAFLAFLMSELVQQKALVHGFRPGNPDVPVRFPESPFVQHADVGLKIEITTVCDPPRGEVLENLLQSWHRSRSGR